MKNIFFKRTMASVFPTVPTSRSLETNVVRASNLCITVLAFLGAALQVSEASASVIDQSVTPNITLVAQARDIDWWGQSFTAGQTGNLDKVGALIMQEPGVAADMQFTLFSIINNQALVSQGISLNISNSKIPVGYGPLGNYSLNDMMTIDLSQYNFQVVAGMEYGMLVHSSIGFNQRPMINWFGGCGNNQTVQCGFNNGTTDEYLAGTPLAINAPLTDFTVYPRTDFDFAFATYVTPVPEPETYVMMLMGLGLMCFVAHQRKQT